MAKAYDQVIKDKVIKERLNGSSIKSISIKNGVSVSVIHKWWIEVGYATIVDRTTTLSVYEMNLIHMIDISVAIDLIIESIKNTTN